MLEELPPKQYSVVSLPLSNRAEYRSAERDLFSWIEEERGLEAAERASKVEWLSKIAVLRGIAARGKLKAATEWARAFAEDGEKLVLFAHHVEIQEALVKAFGGAPWIQGGVTPQRTESEKARFWKDEPIIVCSLLAGGVGHNLHCDGRCSSVALLEHPWTPGHVDQAIDRVHRIGQTNRVNAYHLVAEGTIDEDMIATILAKQEVVDKATDGKVRDSLLGESVENDLILRLQQRARLVLGKS